MGKATRFYGVVDNVGVGTLKHGAEDYPEVPILDGVTLDDRHRAQSEFWFETGADSVRFIGTAYHVGVEVTYSFYPHFDRAQLMTFYRLLGKEVLTVETECEDGIYTISYGYDRGNVL